MRRALIVFLMFILALQSAAERRRRAVAIGPQPQVAVTFTGIGVQGGPEVVLDADDGKRSRTAQRKRTNRSTISTRTFGIRVARTSGENRGTATVRAFLENCDERWNLRIDGKAIGSMPIVIDAAAPLGAVRMHTIEMDIPNTTEGSLFSSIAWEITTND